MKIVSKTSRAARLSSSTPVGIGSLALTDNSVFAPTACILRIGELINGTDQISDRIHEFAGADVILFVQGCIIKKSQIENTPFFSRDEKNTKYCTFVKMNKNECKLAFLYYETYFIVINQLVLLYQ